MNKITLRISVRQLIASAECKLYTFKNDVIIHDYVNHVEALKLVIINTTYNRAERERLLRLLATCAPVSFPMACFHDTEALKAKLIQIKNKIPSLI